MVGASSAELASEEVAEYLSRESGDAGYRWVRPSPLDADPAHLSLTLGAALARSDAPTNSPEARESLVLRHADLGAIYDGFREARALVIEDYGRVIPASVVSALARSPLPGSDVKLLVVVRGHPRPLRRFFRRLRGEARRPRFMTGAEVEEFAERVGIDLADLDAERLIQQTGGRRSIIRDVLEVARSGDIDAIRDADPGPLFPEAFLLKLSRRLVSARSTACRDALEVANQLCYWNAAMGREGSLAEIPGSQLKPWMVPLANGWFWLRPAWAPSLRAALADSGLRAIPSGGAASGSLGPTKSLVRSAGRSAVETPPAAPPEVASPNGPTETASGAPPDLATAPAMTHDIHVQMLGGFSLTIGEQPFLEWRGRIGPTILKFLLLQAEWTSPAEVLLDTFWRDVPPQSARGRLHAAVSSLRRDLRLATDDLGIEFHQESYVIRAHRPVTFDVSDFRDAVSAAKHVNESAANRSYAESLERALQLYQGHLLPEHPYDEWVLLPRELLRMDWLDMLERAAEAHFDLGRPAESIGYARQLIEQDACHEAAHQLLMRCYAKIGRPRQAERQFEICDRALRESLGAEPSSATRALHDEIRSAAQERRPPAA